MNTCLRFVGAGAFAAAVVLGQGVDSRSGFPVQGEISSATPFIGSMTVELSSDGAGPTETAVVHPDGTFEFRSAQPGAHELRVIGSGGAVIHQETVFITRGGHSLSIRLAAPSAAAGSSDGTISVQQLGHKISPPARKAFDKGAKALAKQDYGQAAESFRQAVAIDPEFADAQNELGVAEAAVGDLPHAVESFQKAVDLV